MDRDRIRERNHWQSFRQHRASLLSQEETTAHIPSRIYDAAIPVYGDGAVAVGPTAGAVAPGSIAVRGSAHCRCREPRGLGAGLRYYGDGAAQAALATGSAVSATGGRCGRACARASGADHDSAGGLPRRPVLHRRSMEAAACQGAIRGSPCDGRRGGVRHACEPMLPRLP